MPPAGGFAEQNQSHTLEKGYVTHQSHLIHTGPSGKEGHWADPRVTPGWRALATLESHRFHSLQTLGPSQVEGSRLTLTDSSCLPLLGTCLYRHLDLELTGVHTKCATNYRTFLDCFYFTYLRQSFRLLAHYLNDHNRGVEPGWSHEANLALSHVWQDPTASAISRCLPRSPWHTAGIRTQTWALRCGCRHSQQHWTHYNHSFTPQLTVW